jgi:hypothetical protein
MSDRFLVYVDITCWSYSLGGEHFSARLVWTDADGKYYSIELEHPLSSKEALALNKKDGSRGMSLLHRPGEMSYRFFSKEQLCSYAIKHYKEYSPDAIALVKGSSAVADPQCILDGPKAFKDAVNKLWLEHERIGGYEGNEKG